MNTLLYVIIAIPLILFFSLLLGGLFRLFKEGSDDPHAPASKDSSDFWKTILIGFAILLFIWYLSS